MQAVRHVPRAGEHHVLEQVREAGASRHLVFRADVIPHVDRDSRCGVILREDHGETVWEFVSFKWNLDRVGRGGVLLLAQQRLGQRDHQNQAYY